MKSTENKTTREKADQHDVTFPLLKSMYEEIKDISKKKPEAVINKSKIQMINRLLNNCRKILNDEASLEYLDLIDEDDVPQYSDVVLVISQYVAAMEQFKDKYFGWNGIDNTWYLKKVK